MTLAAGVVIPAAPLLVPGVTARLPSEAAAVVEAVDAALAALPAHDLLVLLAGATAGRPAQVWSGGQADLGGLSRPDLSAALPAWTGADELGRALGAQPAEGPLPVDLAVLALQSQRHAASPAVVAVGVPWGVGNQLADMGAALVRQTAGLRVAVVASGDLSAGLSEKAPRHSIDGAAAWDAAAVAALEAGDATALAALGPDEAARVVSRGWPGLVMLLGALAAGGLALGRVEYAAPRGVGYVVASA